MVTAYPVQACITEITGPASGNLVIRPTWCHSLFWNQMPLRQCSTAVALWTRARPPAGAVSPSSPQSAGFLPTRSHSSARPPLCCCPPSWLWSTGLPWLVMHPWIFCKLRPTGGDHYLKKTKKRKKKSFFQSCNIHSRWRSINPVLDHFWDVCLSEVLNWNSEWIIYCRPELSGSVPQCFNIL